MVDPFRLCGEDANDQGGWTVGKIGNTAAGMKAMHDTYQTAQREYNTTTERIAYMAGTLLAGYAMGKTANWGANKLKNLANKALPKLKTAVQEGAERLANQFRKGFGTSGSGHMSRNRGFVVNSFYKGGSNTAKLRDTKNIRYSQDNIRGIFDDGTNVNELVYHLKNSPEYAATIEPIRLVKYNDLPNEVQQYLSKQGVRSSTVFTLDNRRLYAAK